MINTDKVFTFGKFAGIPLSKVLADNYDYCMWLKEQEWCKKHEELYNEIKDLKEKPPAMPWGKYKGKSIRDIWSTDDQYFNWLKNNDIIKNNRKVYAEICKYD